MKRILIFSLAYYPHVSGAEIAVREITDRINPSDIEFHLICNRYDTSLPKTERVGTVHVHRIGFGRKRVDIAETYGPLFYLAKILFIPLAVLKARTLHRTYHFDGLWAVMAYMTFPVTLLRLVGVRLPYVLTLQEGDSFGRVFERWRIRLVRPLLTYGIRHAAVVQAISSFLGGWARRAGFDGPLEIIPNGVDVSLFSKALSPEDRTAIRKKCLGDRDGTLVLHVGRIVPKNGIEDTIEALTYLPSDISFVQVGAGPDKEKLVAHAGKLGVSDRVRFLGCIDHSELPKYFHAADIFVQPSLSEGMGNVFIEAFAARVPVVATQVGGIADFLYDPERNPGYAPTGRAVDAHDPKGIARAILAYLENREVTGQIVENAYALVKEKYDWDRIAHDMRTRVFSGIGLTHTAKENRL
ncbi:glycosyltransferase family 4 protein [Candidatus Kaiserbacteria bacterium]|nr:glycosyltransferase family 4 protein [Candidatus Kaiserbacteria bacterium]